MSKPLYSVGDAVSLVCVPLPQYNGDYEVSGIVYSDTDYVCRVTGVKVRYCSDIGEVFGYTLHPPLEDPDTGTEAAFSEHSLRRRYSPSSESFKEMMLKLTRVPM